jgi:hypothetical protein
MKTSLLCKQSFDKVRAILKAKGCKFKIDRDAGTAEATYEDEIVFRAIQKGKGQPWIAMFRNTASVTWTE